MPNKPKHLTNLTKKQAFLLLHLEDRATNNAGAVDLSKLSEDEVAQAGQWQKEGFIEWGRICAADIAETFGKTTNQHQACMWVKLSDDAWRLAQEERRAKAGRTWNARSWRTTEEYRNE